MSYLFFYGYANVLGITYKDVLGDEDEREREFVPYTVGFRETEIFCRDLDEVSNQFGIPAQRELCKFAGLENWSCTASSDRYKGDNEKGRHVFG